MSQEHYCPQENFLRECRRFKAGLEHQAHILEQGSNKLNSEKLEDMTRDMTRLSLQMDWIVELGLQMVAEAFDGTVVQSNPPFWSRPPNAGPSSFEKVFYSMQRTVDQIGLALKLKPRKQKHGPMIEDLKGMASVLETNLGL